MSKKNPNEFPPIRVWKIANARADEIVAALKAKGIKNVSKTSLVSEMLLAMPVPSVIAAVTHRKRTRKAAPAHQ